VLKTIVFMIPLALDTFAVSAAIGVAGLPDHQRLRVSAIFAGFEMVMPLVGFAVGRALGGAVGGLADYLAIAILVAVGVTMQRTDADDAAIARAASNTHGAAILALGMSISLDELAIGLTIGLLRLPILLVVLLIGAQAFIAAQLGHRLGTRLGEQITEGAEKLAGVVLVLLGLTLLIQRFA
jgi:manganese efflux pump family protein